MSRLRKPPYISNLRKHGCAYSMSWLVVLVVSAGDFNLPLIVDIQPYPLLLLWTGLLLAHFLWQRANTHRLLQRRTLQPVAHLTAAERLALHQHLVDGGPASSVQLVGDDGEFIERA